MKLTALGMAAGTAALLLAGTPAMASAQPASQALTGPESAYGVIHGAAAASDSPVIPVAWRGLVAGRGTFAPTGGAPTQGTQHTFATSAGTLTVVITAAPVSKQTENLKACHFSATTYVDFTIVGGESTGAFAGASGPGAIEVHFAGYEPRYPSGPKKGQCNTSPNAPELAKGAVASFLLSAVMTTS